MSAVRCATCGALRPAPCPRCSWAGRVITIGDIVPDPTGDGRALRVVQVCGLGDGHERIVCVVDGREHAVMFWRTDGYVRGAIWGAPTLGALLDQKGAA
jgi:hypothetical protein